MLASNGAAQGRTAIGSKYISPMLVGAFFEDLNYAADGGLYAELVQNRSFEYAPSDIDLRLNRDNTWHSLTAWQFVRTDNAIGRVTVESASPLNDVNRHYAQITTRTPGTMGVGLRNLGYDGICIDSAATYHYSAFVRASGGKMVIRLVADKEVVAQQTLDIHGNGWQQLSCDMRPLQTRTDATLEVLFPECGTYDVDMVSLFPNNTYKERAGGLRLDLAEALENLHPAFMRFPGGCLAHGDGLANIYRWKETIGPIEQRTEQPNIWNYRQSRGLGYHEYLQFCEDIGAEPLPVVAAGVSCQNSARRGGDGQEQVPMEQMGEYIQDILDLVEYCNGDPSTKWGRQRAEAGHPAPFNLKYIGIGNEDRITPAFTERFSMICKALKKHCPEIRIIGTSGPFHSGDDFDNGWQAARVADVWAVDEHYYVRPEWLLDNLHRYDSYPRSGPKVYLGEWATRGNKWWNALCEAAYLCHLERNGDVVAMTSYAPLIARHGHTQWKPDLIFFDATQVYPTVNYTVQQLFATHRGDRVWTGVVTDAEGNEADATSCVTKGRDIFIRLINTADKPVRRILNLKPLCPRTRQAIIKVLYADRDAEVTPMHPHPLNHDERIQKTATTFVYDMPPLSITLISI